MVFLELENFRDYFNYVLMPTMSENNRISRFSSYFFDTYDLFVDFPLNIWASASATSTRTVYKECTVQN